MCETLEPLFVFLMPFLMVAGCVFCIWVIIKLLDNM